MIAFKFAFEFELFYDNDSPTVIACTVTVGLSSVNVKSQPISNANSDANVMYILTLCVKLNFLGHY